jgi:hypothetical protein
LNISAAWKGRAPPAVPTIFDATLHGFGTVNFTGGISNVPLQTW